MQTNLLFQLVAVKKCMISPLISGLQWTDKPIQVEILTKHSLYCILFVRFYFSFSIFATCFQHPHFKHDHHHHNYQCYYSHSEHVDGVGINESYSTQTLGPFRVRALVMSLLCLFNVIALLFQWHNPKSYLFSPH